MFTQMAVKSKPVGYSNCFVLETKFQCGDADYTLQEERVIQKEDLFDVAAFYQACEGIKPMAEGGPGYDGVPGYDRFGGFPYDHHYSCQSALDSWAVFYYSEMGTKFQVEFQ